MDSYLYILAIVGGFVAGIMNTLAGFGSAVTLGIMIEFMGLPANIANGTNRINTFTQTSLSSFAFYRKGKLNIKKCWPLIVVTFIGALIGVYLAVVIDNEIFKEVYKYLLLIMFFVILINPKRWIRKNDENFRLNRWISFPLFLLLGILGGFIQMGMGLFVLVVLVLLSKYNLIEANAIKVTMIAIYTFFILIIYHYQGLVNWKIGLLFALGQGAGGYLAATISSVYPKADVWVYRLLILIIFVILLKSFGVFSIFG